MRLKVSNLLFILLFNKVILYVTLNFFNYYGSPNVYIQIGNNTKLENFDLDMSIDYLWLSSSLYLPENDNTIKMINNNVTIIPETNTTGMQLESSITIPESNITLNNFTYFFTIDLFFLAFDSIPLAYQFKNSSYSFVHTLYNLKYINRKSFNFIFHNRDNGTLTFGEPISNFNKKPYQTSCNIDKNLNTWTCKLVEIKVNNNIYLNTHISLFQSNVRPIRVPKDFMKYLNETIFNKLYSEKFCVYELYWDCETIKCECDKIQQDIRIDFDFDNNVFSLYKDDLFQKVNNSCNFLIEENIKGGNKWFIGTAFYYKYITDFDYDNARVTFFSDNPFNSKIDKKLIIKGIIICFEILMFLGNLYLLISVFLWKIQVVN